MNRLSGRIGRTWMQIVTLIHGLRGDGVSIIVVTHDRELVTALGARIVELTPQGASGEWQQESDGPRPIAEAAERQIRIAQLRRFSQCSRSCHTVGHHASRCRVRTAKRSAADALRQRTLRRRSSRERAITR
jgi:ATPase subunit of ABC transporter with duplicated ATPase domains